MDDARGSFPRAGGQNSDLSQSEFSTAGRAAFRVEGVEFFEINDQGVFPTEGVFHGGHSCSYAGGVVYASFCFFIIHNYGRNRSLSSLKEKGHLKINEEIGRRL
jgi:hypothetical protein